MKRAPYYPGETAATTEWQPAPPVWVRFLSGVDLGSSRVDSGWSEVDPGSSEVDPGSSEVDPGSSEVDLGSSEVDLGSSEVDLGSSEVDPGSSRVGSFRGVFLRLLFSIWRLRSDRVAAGSDSTLHRRSA